MIKELSKEDILKDAAQHAIELAGENPETFEDINSESYTQEMHTKFPKTMDSMNKPIDPRDFKKRSVRDKMPAKKIPNLFTE